MVTRNASDRMSETLNTIIGPSLANECNSDSDGHCKKSSNPGKDRMDCKRLSNCLSNSRRSAIESDESRIEGELEVIEEYSIIEVSTVLGGESIRSRRSWNCFARSGRV